MTETECSAVLSRADVGAVQALAEQILARSDHRVLQPPLAGMIMMQVIEPVDHLPFFLGEVLITECEVQVGECVARGCALGEDPDRAFCTAVILAALASGEQPLRPQIEMFLAEQAEALAARRAREAALVARTRVQFDTLEDQDAQHKGSRL